MGYTETMFCEKTVKAMERIATSLEHIESYLKVDRENTIDKVNEDMRRIRELERNMAAQSTLLEEAKMFKAAISGSLYNKRGDQND